MIPKEVIPESRSHILKPVRIFLMNVMNQTTGHNSPKHPREKKGAPSFSKISV